MDRTLLDRALTDAAPVRPLPEDIAALLRQLSAPPRLAAHLRAVHDVAWQLTEAIEVSFPALPFNREEVLFGAGHTRHRQNDPPNRAFSARLTS